jgi:hypothetical protein
MMPQDWKAQTGDHHVHLFVFILFFFPLFFDAT